MSEWRGPVRCRKCNSFFDAYRPRLHYADKSNPLPCDGELRPYERRRAPQPDALVEALRERVIAAIRRAPSWTEEITDGSVEVVALGHVLAAVESALAVPRPERTYSAAEVQEAFVDGACWADYKVHGPSAEAEAQRRYGERKDGEAGR